MTARRRLLLPFAALLLLPAAALGASREIAELEASLAARRRAIEADRKALNADCGSVPSTDAGKVADCRRRQADVLRRMDEYKADRKRLDYLKATEGGGEAVRKEQDEYLNRREAWGLEQKRLVEERLKEPDGSARALADSLRSGKPSIPPPPDPGAGFKDLRPGDVILVDPEKGWGSKVTRWTDQVTSWNFSSPASHSVLYLKEVNGTKLFLDHTIDEGGTVITEERMLEKYGERGMHRAALAKPLNAAEARDLWDAAADFQKREAEKRGARQGHGPVRDFFETTGYGVAGDDVVCSEADRWALLHTGRRIPGSKSWVKHALGVSYGPADIYADTQNFLVTPLYAPPKDGGP